MKAQGSPPADARVQRLLRWLLTWPQSQRSNRYPTPLWVDSLDNSIQLEPRLLPAPIITAALGDVREGRTVTLTGDAFGSVGPMIDTFDNFEGGSNGTPVRLGIGSATVGQWDLRSGDITYSSTNRVSGTLAARANMATTPSNVTALLPGGTQDVFVSYATLIPGGTLWPGQGSPDRINWKRVWLMGDDSTKDDDRFLPADLGSTVAATDPTEHNLDANNAPLAPYFNSSITRGTWLQTSAWIKGRTDSTGAIQLWEVTPSGVQQKVNETNVQTLYPDARGGTAPHEFGRIVMNGYGRRTDNSFPTFDDFYVATGPGARARVEIGNRPTYAASTKLAITTPTAWSNTQIRTTVRQGAFRTGETAYLFVVTADGVVSQGRPITIGQPAAAVEQVFVGSTRWAPSFRAHLQTRSLGGAQGFALPAGGPAQPLPWVNLDQVTLRFTRDVRVAQGDLTIRGVSGGVYPVTGFVYNAAEHIATWTVGRNIGNDRVTLTMSPSVTGASVSVPFVVLPGDVNRDGTVLAADASAVKRKFFTTTTGPGSGDAAYSAFHDVNGSGAILADDFSAVKQRFFTSPPAAAAPPLLGAPLPATPAAMLRAVRRDLLSVAPVLG
jgi:hypothetical protein